MTTSTLELLKSSESVTEGQKLKKEQLTIRFSPSQISAIRKLADQTGVSTAESARRLLDLGLQEVQGGRE